MKTQNKTKTECKEVRNKMDMNEIEASREKYFNLSEVEERKIIEDYKTRKFKTILKEKFKSFMDGIDREFKNFPLTTEERKKLVEKIKWEWEEKFIYRILNNNSNFIQLKDMKYLPYWFEQKIKERDKVIAISLKLHLEDVDSGIDCFDVPIIRHLEKAKELYREEEQIKNKVINAFLKG